MSLKRLEVLQRLATEIAGISDYDHVRVEDARQIMKFCASTESKIEVLSGALLVLIDAKPRPHRETTAEIFRRK